ncbi:NAD(P)/FAD-dependent oxidoreductase [Occallatibacter savannae]|uniref:NAD(P)/FAD-dependent oxidoreductase n=1 Tax=Occallatibacter savannae TaxID=1002691 RepID=UPI000D686F76|nr:NAD(P)/FAD-dependent oxidoreductase [Occallatibacter savannae]
MSAAPRQFDIIILGAGAAGLMCASVAGQRSKGVLVLEHNPQPGRKILISGGGRCNFTNIHTTPENFISSNPHFAKSALALYQPRHFLELVERYRIQWHEKTLGQLFCDNSSRQILDMLLAECDRGHVDIQLNARDISVEHTTGEFHIRSSAGEFKSAALVVATGGLSIPKMGATGLTYDLARQFGLQIIEPRPALVPLLLSGVEKSWTELTGVSADVTAQAPRGPAFREKLLFTHRGLSGPAILQASSYLRHDEPVEIDFAPAISSLLSPLLKTGARRDNTAFRSALQSALPHRLAAHLADVAAPQRWTNPALESAERSLHHWRFHPTGTEGFEKAEVTAGGIDTAGLSSRTMEARTIPGLFFIGEAVDVTGHLGGFNFQWAWASAVAAARAL